MTYVVTFNDAQPSARVSGVWTQVGIQEAPPVTLTPVVELEVQTLSPVDTDPASPAARDITTTLATLADGMYRLRFIDAGGNVEFTDWVSHSQAAYFTVAELRARFPSALANTSTYTDAALEYWRAYVEERIEKACDVAFVPRTVTSKVVSGSGSTSLELPNTLIRTITSATDDGTTVDVSDALVDSGSVYLAAGWTLGTRNLTVTYTHGYDSPPLAVKEAAMLWTRELAVKGPITERQTQIATESGASINLATPGLFGSISGLPSVDEVLNEYRQPSFVG